MEAREQELLKSVLEKRRNCVPLTKEEQAWVDSTFNKLFEKKFGNRVFAVKTGEEIRKAAGVDKSKAGAQSEKPISEDVPFAEKKDIEGDDPSGKVKAEEEGEYVDADEKNEGGEAEHTNASDITHADNEDLQRKPTFKFGDVVAQSQGGRTIAGIIVKYYAARNAVMVKWANGTFSTVSAASLEKVADKYKEEDEKANPPIVKPADDKDKDDGVPANSVKTAADVKKAEDAVCAECAKKPGDEKCAACKEAAAKEVEKTDEPKDEPKPESEEKPVDEAAETPAEQAAEQEAGTEVHEKPTDDELQENEWMNAVKALVSKNADVENADAICSYFKANVSKSEGDEISMPIDEVRKSNPRLAAEMEKRGHKSINLGKKKGESGTMPMTLGTRG